MSKVIRECDLVTIGQPTRAGYIYPRNLVEKFFFGATTFKPIHVIEGYLSAAPVSINPSDAVGRVIDVRIDSNDHVIVTVEVPDSIPQTSQLAMAVVGTVDGSGVIQNNSELICLSMVPTI